MPVDPEWQAIPRPPSPVPVPRLMSALVGVIMGSQSDWDTLRFTCETLDELGVEHEVRVVSAHRTPDLLFEYASTAQARGLEIIIAGGWEPALKRRLAQTRKP